MAQSFPGAPADAPAADARGPASGDEADPRAPVIVLTYAHAGAEILTQPLSLSRSLACTTATGLLPLCHEALGTWQQAEGRDGPPSPLAIKSVSVLASTIITVIQARCGARRWLETAFTRSAVARTFLQVFPTSRFLCMHRSLRGVVGEAARAYPWGLAGSPFFPFSTAHPGNNVATIAAYWAAHTEDLLDFEAENQGSCLRVRYEDLTEDHGRRLTEIITELGLDSSEIAVLQGPRARPSAEDAEVDSWPPVPSGQIPPQHLAMVRDLHARLGYDPWPE